MFNPQCLRPKQNCIELHYWVINSSVTINRLLKMYYIIKLYYFVAVLSLTYAYFVNVFLKIKTLTK